MHQDVSNMLTFISLASRFIPIFLIERNDCKSISCSIVLNAFPAAKPMLLPHSAKQESTVRRESQTIRKTRESGKSPNMLKAPSRLICGPP